VLGVTLIRSEVTRHNWTDRLHLTIEVDDEPKTLCGRFPDDYEVVKLNSKRPVTPAEVIAGTNIPVYYAVCKTCAKRGAKVPKIEISCDTENGLKSASLYFTAPLDTEGCAPAGEIASLAKGWLDSAIAKGEFALVKTWNYKLIDAEGHEITERRS
jgi:hypothetical protein